MEAVTAVAMAEIMVVATVADHIVAAMVAVGVRMAVKEWVVVHMAVAHTADMDHIVVEGRMAEVLTQVDREVTVAAVAPTAARHRSAAEDIDKAAEAEIATDIGKEAVDTEEEEEECHSLVDTAVRVVEAMSLEVVAGVKGMVASKVMVALGIRVRAVITVVIKRPDNRSPS